MKLPFSAAIMELMAEHNVPFKEGRMAITRALVVASFHDGLDKKQALEAVSQEWDIVISVLEKHQ